MSHHLWAFCQRAFEKSCRSANHHVPSLHSFLRIPRVMVETKGRVPGGLIRGRGAGRVHFPETLVEGTSYFGSSTRRLSPRKCGLKLHWVWELTSDKSDPGWNRRRSLELWNTHKYSFILCMCVHVHLWTGAHNHETSSSHQTILAFYFSNCSRNIWSG